MKVNIIYCIYYTYLIKPTGAFALEIISEFIDIPDSPMFSSQIFYKLKNASEMSLFN